MDERLRSRWPGRGSANRLEPDCRPIMQPSFSLDPAEPVFTIGSCFARNVERRLKARGFDIPAIRFIQDHPEVADGQGTEVLNKYTPPSIYQELAWTRKILDRDDRVTAEDVEPLLLELPSGKVIDTHRRSFEASGITREKALAFRRLFYSLFRRAFDCPSLVITLGLIECWKDKYQNDFIEFNPTLLTMKDRFSLHVLDYNEALDYVQNSIDLLGRDRKPKILLTTSPVPLNRTFTDDDVIVANMYSKSVLRAVAGFVAAKNDNVDYFPSYEAVTMTRRPEIWAKDLIHIQESFIDDIMERVVQNYVPAPDQIQSDEFKQFALLVRERKWDEAALLYGKVEGRDPETMDEFYLRAAEFELWRQKPEAAAVLAGKAIKSASKDPQYHFRCAILSRRIKNLGSLEACRLKGAELCGSDVKQLQKVTKWLSRHHEDDALWLMETVENNHGNEPEILKWLTRKYESLGRSSDVRRIYGNALASEHTEPSVLVQYAMYLFKNDDREAAAIVAEQAFARGAKDTILAKRMALWFEQSRTFDRAAVMFSILCELEPTHVRNWVGLARCNAAAGKWSEVIKACERAESVVPEKPEIDDFRKQALAQQSGFSLLGLGRTILLGLGRTIRNKMRAGSIDAVGEKCPPSARAPGRQPNRLFQWLQPLL